MDIPGVAWPSPIEFWDISLGENVMFGLSVRAIAVPLKYLKLNFSLKRKVVHRIIWNTGNQFTVEIKKKKKNGFGRQIEKKKSNMISKGLSQMPSCPGGGGMCNWCSLQKWDWGHSQNGIAPPPPASWPLPNCPLRFYTQTFTTDPKGQASFAWKKKIKILIVPILHLLNVNIFGANMPMVNEMNHTQFA